MNSGSRKRSPGSPRIWAKRWGIRIEISDDTLAKPLDDATAGLVFRAVRELLTNVLEHAPVRSAHVSYGGAAISWKSLSKTRALASIRKP
jgi:hypothetical protein